ncbi:MAG TPA: hypothetical protein VFS42_08155 [Burkholderiaceae bacterium]|nr:hypothetical protein [Burkholderiaceae bacterium]
MSTTLTRLLEPHARPAQILLRRARTLELTSAQREALPPHLEAGDAHLHHSLSGHRPIEVGDVLLDDRGGFWIVNAAPEMIWRVCGPINSLIAAAHVLGHQHIRVSVGESSFDMLPNEAQRAMLELRALHIEDVQAPFTPEPLPVVEHEHVHHEGCGHDHHHHGHDHHDHRHEH